MEWMGVLQGAMNIRYAIQSLEYCRFVFINIAVIFLCAMELSNVLNKSRLM